MTALRNSPDELSALVSRTSGHTGLPVAYVEKDFWVTEVLRAACVERYATGRDGSESPVSFIFKGGTSLSRVYGIIDRFSEDVDLLAVFASDTSTAARHKVLKQVHADVVHRLGLSSDQSTIGSSTKGVKRYTTYRYPTRSTNADMREGVVLELGCRGGDHPVTEHPYRSLVAAYATVEIGESPETWDEFEPFTISVLAPERTLLEKLAAVHDAATRNDVSALSKHGRHFYDIERLLSARTVTQALHDLGQDGISDLVDDINAHSDAAGLTWTPRPAGGYADSPAFDPGHSSHRAIAVGYAESQALIHGDSVSLERVHATVAASSEIL